MVRERLIKSCFLLQLTIHISALLSHAQVWCELHRLPAVVEAIAHGVSLQSSGCVSRVMTATLLYAGPQGSVLQVPTSSPAFSPSMLKAATLQSMKWVRLLVAQGIHLGCSGTSTFHAGSKELSVPSCSAFDVFLLWYSMFVKLCYHNTVTCSFYKVTK